ncbi:hypothetical protein Q8A73_018168 [Channa argus]|nr:hypothetical protein Q8A73_018168 [Channa argus]
MSKFRWIKWFLFLILQFTGKDTCNTLHEEKKKKNIQNITNANSQETERDLDNTPKSMAANNGWLIGGIVSAAVLVIVLLVAFIVWKKRKGNQKQIIENMVEPDDVVPYASINIIQKPNDKAKVQNNEDKDDSDTVTYCTVKLSSSTEASTIPTTSALPSTTTD